VHTIEDKLKAVYELCWEGYEIFTGRANGVVNAYDIRKLSDNSYKSNMLYSINLNSHGAVRGLQIDATKIVSGSILGAITVSSRSDGHFIYQLTHNQHNDFKSTNMSTIDMNESTVMGADFNGVLSIYDYTSVESNTILQEDLESNLDDSVTTKKTCRQQ
jgi:hypothetical protein